MFEEYISLLNNVDDNSNALTEEDKKFIEMVNDLYEKHIEAMELLK